MLARSAPARPAALALAALALAAGGGGPADPGRLPPIVFVSRAPLTGAPGVVPGLGPAGRAAITRGALWVREPDGRLRRLAERGGFLDVADPAVAPDGERVAFAAVAPDDGAWRLWMVRLDDGALAPLTRGDRAPLPPPFDGPRFARYDDLDPCWVGAHALVFASTRWPQQAPYDQGPVTNLFEVDDRGGSPRRLTAERGGAEEPAFDPRAGRVLFTRWWFNPHRAPGDARGAGGAALDSANLWQAMELRLETPADLRVAAGDFATRLGSMAYQPALLADGSIVAVYAANTGLSPSPGATGIQRFEHRLDGHRRLAGAVVPETPESPYGSPRGLAAPSACSPAGLPDGRIVFAYDPSGRGDFGLWVMRADGSDKRPLADLPGTLELDPAPAVRWRAPAARGAATVPAAGPSAAPPTRVEDVTRPAARFRYHDLDAFAPAGVAPARVAGARVRFFAALARPDRVSGDSVVMVREAPVAPSGAIDVPDLPAGVPMFEEIVDDSGRVLRGPRGLAHVAGLNVGDPASPSTCIGCHRGHSTLLRDGRTKVRLGPGAR